MGILFVLPILLYAGKSTPPPEELEGTLHSKYGRSLDRSRSNSAHIASFLSSQTDATSNNMDAVYGDLLKSGRGRLKRHYELTGPLAETVLKGGTEEEKKSLGLSQPLTAVSLDLKEPPLVQSGTPASP